MIEQVEIEETKMFADEEPKANENQEDGMVEPGANQTNAFSFFTTQRYMPWEIEFTPYVDD